MKVGAKIKERPAETGGLVGTSLVGALLAFGVDPKIAALVGMVAGAVPAVVTYLVTHGGVSGVLGKLWHG